MTTKKEFLIRLLDETGDTHLVAYYDELISDRVEAGESESDVIKTLDIKRVVRNSEFETARIDLETETRDKRGGRGWVVLLMLFSAPVTIPLAFALLITLISLFAVAIGMVGGAAGGLVMGGLGIVEMIRISEPIGLILLSSGLYLIGLVIIAVLGVWIGRLLIRLYGWIVVNFFRIGKNRRNA
ncbi:MAG: DUF1700 domain-containing protein [Firmicutes bacterium]|nr:DUF1700 domain-containing protein [Bacillota bacterium]